jgi:hypothetical protein
MSEKIACGIVFILSLICALLFVYGSKNGKQNEKQTDSSGYIVTDKGIKRDVKVYLEVTVCNKTECVKKELTVEEFNAIKVGDVFHE